MDIVTLTDFAQHCKIVLRSRKKARVELQQCAVLTLMALGINSIDNCFATMIRTVARYALEPLWLTL